MQKQGTVSTSHSSSHVTKIGLFSNNKSFRMFWLHPFQFCWIPLLTSKLPSRGSVTTMRGVQVSQSSRRSLPARPCLTVVLGPAGRSFTLQLYAPASKEMEFTYGVDMLPKDTLEKNAFADEWLHRENSRITCHMSVAVMNCAESYSCLPFG